MGRERWFRGGHEGQERPFDWYTLAKERDIPLEQARVLYEEASRRASDPRGPHRSADALYLELLEGARQEAAQISPGKITRTMRLAAERAGKRPSRRPAAPGKRTLTSYLEPPARERRTTGHGGGAALPDDVRRKMEAAFGVDFSPVRVHEGPHAQAVGALAYTRGTDIHFAPGQYQPKSRRGQELLGHELAHVVQQSHGSVRATAHAGGVDINDDAALEREADEMGARAARGDEHERHAGAAAGGESAQAPLDTHAGGGGQRAVQRTPLPAEVRRLIDVAGQMQERIERLREQYPDARDPHRVEMQVLHADALFDELTALIGQTQAAGQALPALHRRMLEINELIGRMERARPRPAPARSGEVAPAPQGGVDGARPGQYPPYFGPASIDAMRRIERQVDTWSWVGRLTIGATVIAIATSQSGTRPGEVAGNAATTALTGSEGVGSIEDGGALDVGTQAESLLAGNHLARMGIIQIAEMTLVTESLNPRERRFWEDLLANMPAYRGRGERRVQGKGGIAGVDPVAALDLAERGVAGGGGALPHLDRIQAAFGDHDVSAVRAHVGGTAAAASIALGAHAYATGDDVAFAAAPDLHLAAHEAAHVVQQRAGVNLAGGMSRADDEHERHADAVAERVVRGQPAQPLLDGYAASGAAATRSSSAVQMRWGDPGDQACVALRQFVDRVPPERLERTLRAWNQAVWTRRGATVVLPTNRDPIAVPIDDAREAVRALQARAPSTPDPQSGEPAQDQEPARPAQGAGATEPRPGESAPDPAWDAFAGRFTSEFADVLHAFGGGELDGQRLRQTFTVGQRNELRQFTEDHMIPDRLFNSGDVARRPAQQQPVTAQQRILLSGHILANGRYRRPEQEAERAETQRMEARSCGHWANMVNAYAGVPPAGGVGVEQNFDHAGNVVLGGATPTRPIDSAHAREGEGAGAPNWRAAPWAELRELQAGDWLYIYNGQGGAETTGRGGQHSVIFSRWIEQRERQAYWIAETFDQLHNRSRRNDDPEAQDTRGQYQGGARHQHKLGETYSRADRIYPVTRIVRVGEDDNPADTPEQLLPEAGSSDDIETRNARILSGRDITPDDAIRWVRAENDTLITTISDSQRADGQSRLGDHERRVLQETNERPELETLIRLNERLQGLRTGAAALDGSDERQASQHYETSQGSVRRDDLVRPVGARATTGLVTNVERPLPRR